MTISIIANVELTIRNTECKKYPFELFLSSVEFCKHDITIKLEIKIEIKPVAQGPLCPIGGQGIRHIVSVSPKVAG
jgi:hypothetical protein